MTIEGTKNILLARLICEIAINIFIFLIRKCIIIIVFFDRDVNL